MCTYVQLLVFREHEGPRGSLKRAQRPSVTHRALVWFLPRVSAHVNHQHVLSFEGLLLPRTVLPAAHELLLLSVDVVVIDVLWDTHTERNERIFWGELSTKRLLRCSRFYVSVEIRLISGNLKGFYAAAEESLIGNTKTVCDSGNEHGLKSEIRQLSKNYFLLKEITFFLAFSTSFILLL